MLSLRQLVAQQSQESIKQEDGGFDGLTTSSARVSNSNITTPPGNRTTENNITPPVTLSGGGKKPAVKRKAKSKELPNSDRKPPAKKAKLEEADDSSSGEEWFGDAESENETETDWRGDYQEFSKNYPEALSAIYNPGTAVATPDALATLNAALRPTQIKSFKFQSRIDRLQPRTKEKRRNGIVELITETVEEAQQRVKRIDRYGEKGKMVTNWKSRSINYTLEEDVGNAYEAKAKRLLENEFRSDQRKQLRAEDDNQKKEMKVKKDQHDDDDSEKEQDLLLDRLTQNSIGNETKEEPKTSEAFRDPSIPYKDQMNFWEYGGICPSKDELEKISYNKDLGSFNLIGAKSQVKKVKETQTIREKKMKQMVSFSTFLYGSGYGKKKEAIQPRYFLSTNLGSINPIDRFSNIRRLRTMAVRHLCGQLGDTKTENRLVRDLFTKARHGRTYGPVAEFDANPSSRTMAYQLAVNLLFYNEHTWTDSQMVAKHLGLIGKLAGCTMPSTRVSGFFKSRRTFVSKNYMKGKRQWTHEGSQGKDIHHDTGTATETIAKIPSANLDGDTNITPMGPPTSDGVVFEFHDKPFGNRIFTTDGGTQDAMIAPTSVFAHVPGTKPPVPDFPMEPPSIIFGPVDRYAKFYHKSKFDDTTFRLILATLLSRVAKEQAPGASPSEETTRAQDQLKSFVEDFVRIHSKKTSVLFEQIYRADGASVVQFYRALMSFCSLIASGCPMSVKKAIKKDEVVAIDVDDDDDDLYCNSQDGMRTVASDIVNVVSDHIDRAELLRFPRLRVICALARVASGLPKSAAEILSKAIDGDDIRTPLDLFKQTLEHMENNEMIVSGNEDPDENLVDVGNVEYMFFQSSQILQQCVKVDSLNVDYHLWYIGALAACLLLCSGNKIGGGAHLYPSERKVEYWRYGAKSLRHEVRHKLPKFNEMRRALSSAVNLLFQLGKYQEGPRMHLAICSFLEWNEVVALVVGDSKHEEFGNIQKLHDYHALRWVLVERPPQAHSLLNKRNDGSELSYLAMELENKPGSIDNWRKFVRKLGPLGFNNNGQAHPDHASTCPQCQWLRGGRVLDHQQLASGCWWGANRAWWVDNILQLKCLITKRWTKTSEPVMQKLEQNMPKLAPSSPSHFKLSSTWKEIRKQDLTTEWLPADDGNHDADDQERTAAERSATYGSELPKRLLLPKGLDEAGRLDDYDDDDDDDLFQLPKFQNPLATRLEVLCYKILIFGHLSSEMGQAEDYMHVLMEECILGKRTKLIGVDQECDEFRALQWLSYMGFDIPKMVRASRTGPWDLRDFPATSNDGSSSSGAGRATTTTAVALQSVVS